MTGILDAYHLLGWGIAVALLAVIAGILWERRTRQHRTNKDKVIQSSTATRSEQIIKTENEASGLSSRLGECLLQNSEKVSHGCPSVYKLPVKIDFTRKESMITRKSINTGSRLPLGSKTEKVFMVFGATGTGKTTLINGMVNYILGVQWKDDFRYKLIVEDQHDSQTKGITAYTIYPTVDSAVPYTFTIIDTPGFDVPEGLREDGTITNQIKEFLLMSPPEGIDHLDGIGFVTQASTARLTLKQEYALDSILSIFGKDITKNVFILFTFADCISRPVPFHEVINNVDVPSAKYFKFNNSALFSENGQEADDMFDEMCWKMGARSFRAFFAELENSERVSLHLTKEVWKQSEQVHTWIKELDQQFAMASSKIDQLRKEKLILQQYTKENQASKQFTYTEHAKKLCKVDPKQVARSIKQLNEDIRVVEIQIVFIKDQIQQSLGRLDEVALKPSPLMQCQYLERLIESEKMEARPGYQKRVLYYEKAKSHAEIWPRLKDVDVRQIMEGTPSNELKCTSIFPNSEMQVKEETSKPSSGLDRPLSRLAERLLQNSEKVPSGSPSVYKLPTKITLKRQESKIVKKVIGSPRNIVDDGGTEKVLMVVGATGAGKTTLINGMVNYILGVEWKDDFRYKLVIEDDKVSQANSQTKDITAYTFYPMKGSAVRYTFTIIDTPGFGDTEGLERDRQITDQIKEFFSIPPPDGIDHLDGIGFVTQASLARLTPTQEYIFDSVLSIFGKDVVKNIFMLVTFADGGQPPVMEAIKKANIPSQKYYKFNNSALFAENTEEIEDSFDAMFWKMVVRSFKNFFAEFEKTESVSLQLTQEVLKEREQLQTLIEGLNPQINMGLSKIEEMRQEENVLKQRETEIETNKSFTYEVEFTKPREINLRGTGQHTTTCLRCNFTCHKNCAYANDSDKRNCCAMGSNGNCEVCTMHCHWTDHKNLPYLIEYETVIETRTSDDLKNKYDTAVSGKNKVEGMIEQLEDYLLNVHTTVMKMIVQAQQSLRRLDEIALKPNPLTQLQYLEVLIESEKNEAKPGWQKRVQYYEEAKRQAEILSKVKDVKAAEKAIKVKARSGEKWYSKFRFW